MTDQEPIRPVPVSDEEVVRWREAAVYVRRQHVSEIPDRFICLNIYLSRLNALIARIEADAATIRGLNEGRLSKERCPACGMQTLFLNPHGAITCSWLDCREPVALMWRDSLRERDSLRAQNAAQAEEIERLKADAERRKGSAVDRLHNLCDGFEESDAELDRQFTVLERENAALREENMDLCHEWAQWFVKWTHTLDREANKGAENAELRVRIEALEWLIVAEECVGGECSTIPHATEICSEARAIRARREAEKQG